MVSAQRLRHDVVNVSAGCASTTALASHRVHRVTYLTNHAERVTSQYELSEFLPDPTITTLTAVATIAVKLPMRFYVLVFVAELVFSDESAARFLCPECQDDFDELSELLPLPAVTTLRTAAQTAPSPPTAHGVRECSLSGKEDAPKFDPVTPLQREAATRPHQYQVLFRGPTFTIFSRIRATVVKARRPGPARAVGMENRQKVDFSVTTPKAARRYPELDVELRLHHTEKNGLLLETRRALRSA